MRGIGRRRTRLGPVPGSRVFSGRIECRNVSTARMPDCPRWTGPCPASAFPGQDRDRARTGPGHLAASLWNRMAPRCAAQQQGGARRGLPEKTITPRAAGLRGKGSRHAALRPPRAAQVLTGLMPVSGGRPRVFRSNRFAPSRREGRPRSHRPLRPRDATALSREPVLSAQPGRGWQASATCPPPSADAPAGLAGSSSGVDGQASHISAPCARTAPRPRPRRRPSGTRPRPWQAPRSRS